MTANKNATIKRYMPVETFQDWVRFELKEVSLDTHKPVHFEGPLETEEILTSFKTTPWYQELINDSKVLALYLVGSRALDLHRPESDLDMVVILDERGESIKTRPTICLAYKGTSVHYNAYGYDEIFQAHDITRSEKLFVQQLFVKPEPYAVYLSDKGQKLQKFFINNKNSLLTLGAKLVAYSHASSLRAFEYKPIRAHAIGKWLYHPIMACGILAGAVNTELLFNLKTCTKRAYDKYDLKTTLIKPIQSEVANFSKVIASLNYEELIQHCKAVNNEIVEILNN
jgi:predicted nucleotidyltransferase